jgi:hypothetical protein
MVPCPGRRPTVIRAYAADVAMIERDAIDVGCEERGSAVERLASLVYDLIVAFVWFWILLFVFMVAGLAIRHIF